MRRSQLEHAIRTACQIIGQPAVIIVGSQSIPATYAEDELPAQATMSLEVDVLPIGTNNEEVGRLADQIEGVAGEWSPFEEQHGFSIDGVDLQTAVLPSGWRDRLVRVQSRNTAAPSGSPQFIGWCLDKEDLCVAKLCAYREKDLVFVGALLARGLVDSAVIAERLSTVPHEHRAAAVRRCTPSPVARFNHAEHRQRAQVEMVAHEPVPRATYPDPSPTPWAALTSEYYSSPTQASSTGW